MFDFVKDLFGGIFGGKKWYESLTGWAMLVLLVGDYVVNAGCDMGLLPGAFCVPVLPWTTKVIGLLGLGGLRRAAIN